jgi:hypothetical protein
MRNRILVGLTILAGLAMPIEAKAQAISDSGVTITNDTVSSVSFSLGSADDETQKWIDGTLKSREITAYKVWAKTTLRIAVTSGGFRIIRYYAVLPGERYRIGVDDNQLYDLRQLHARDLGETKLTPVKEEKEAVTSQGQEPLFGTWKLNTAKSKYSPGPAPKSSTVKWEATQDGVRLTVDVVPASGEPIQYEASGKFDGKDNPIKGNNPDGDSVAFSKIDSHTYEAVNKKGGQTTITSHIVVAADGKTRVTTQTGKNGKGETAHNTLSYEKQ